MFLAVITDCCCWVNIASDKHSCFDRSVACLHVFLAYAVRWETNLKPWQRWAALQLLSLQSCTTFPLFAALSAWTLCKVINSCILCRRPSSHLIVSRDYTGDASLRLLTKQNFPCFSDISQVNKWIWHFSNQASSLAIYLPLPLSVQILFFGVLTSILPVQTFLIKRQRYYIDFYCFFCSTGRKKKKAQLSCRSAPLDLTGT